MFTPQLTVKASQHQNLRNDRKLQENAASTAVMSQFHLL